MQVVTMDDDNREQELQRFLFRLDSITAVKARELFKRDVQLFVQLFNALNEELSKFDDAESLLESLKRDWKSGSVTYLSILNTCTALVRMFLAAQDDSSLKLLVSEENLIRVLMVVKSLIESKFAAGSAEMKDTVKPGKASAVKVNHVVFSSLPTAAVFLDAMAVFVEQMKPSGYMASLLLEVCYLSIRSDTYAGLAGIQDYKIRPNLHAFQLSAIGVVRSMYAFHSAYRADIISALVQVVFASLAIKNPLKLFSVPLSSNPDDVVHVSACVICILSCANSVPDDVGDADLMARQYRSCAVFAAEFVQRKEPNEGLGVLGDLIEELLVAMQSPEWMIGSLLLEQIVCKLLILMRQMSAAGSEMKRDLTTINQISELLSMLAEKVLIVKSAMAVPAGLWGEFVLEVRAAVEKKWSQPAPKTWEIAFPKEEEYWSERDSADSTPFLSACEELLMVCDDIIEAAVAVQDGSYAVPPERYLELAVKLLPELHLFYDSSRLLQQVTVHDLHYALLVRHCAKLQELSCAYWHDEAVDTTTQVNAETIVSLWVRYLRMQSNESAGKEVSMLNDYFSQSSKPKVRKPRLLESGGQLPAGSVYFFTKSVIFHTIMNELGNKIEGQLFVALGDPSPSLRARIAKGLVKLVQASNSLIHDNQFKEALLIIVRDRAISVREEGVRMVGLFLLDPANRLNPDIINELCHMLFDEGVSVRKAVVAMFRDIMQSQPDHFAYHDIAVSLLERMIYPKEEESVRESIRSIFQQIWFTAPTDTSLRIMGKVIAAQVPESPVKGIQQSAISTMHIEFTTQRLVQIIASQTAMKSIEKLLRDILHGCSEGDDTAQSAKVRRHGAHAYCERIVQSLVSLVLSTEDALAQANGTAGSHSPQSGRAVAKSAAELELQRSNVFSAIAMFCEVHPPFVAPHVLTFLPYLKQGNGSVSDAGVLRNVMKIMEATAMLPKSILVNRCDDVIRDLSAIVLSRDGITASVAIGCITTLVSHVTRNAEPIFQLAHRCFASLLSSARVMSPQSVLVPQQAAQVSRCLIVLGGICANAKKIEDLIRAATPVGDKGKSKTAKQWVHMNEMAAKNMLTSFTTFEPHLLTGSCYAAAAFAFTLRDETVRARAVQALCDISVGNPRLLQVAHETNLLQDILHDGNSLDIHQRLLTGLHQMLVAEESALEKKASLKQLQDTGVQVSVRHQVLGPGDSDSDASTSGRVIQQNLPALMKFLYRPNVDLRFYSLQLLASLLRHGHVCPLEALAALVMLQCDRDERIREQALQVLVLEDERRHSFLDNRLREGVEMSYDFQHAIFGDVRVSHTLPSGKMIPCFGPLYVSCMQPERRRWKALLPGMVKKCCEDLSCSFNLDSVSADELFKLQMASLTKTQYLTSVLATLPFTFAEEVLLTVYEINREVPIKMEIMLGTMRSMLVDCGAAVAEEATFMAPPSASKPGRKRAIKSTENDDTAEQAAKKKSRGGPAVLAMENELASDQDRCAELLRNMNPKELMDRMVALAMLLLNLRSKEGLIRLKAFLKVAFGLVDEKCSAFNPAAAQPQQERIVLVDADILFAPSSVEAVSLEDLLGNMAQQLSAPSAAGILALVGQLEAMVREFNRMSWLLKCDPDDFSIAPTPKKAVVAAKRSPAVKRSPQKQKTPTTKAKSIEDDEDYDSDHSTASRSSSKSASSPSRGASKRAAAQRPVSYLAPDDFLE